MSWHAAQGVTRIPPITFAVALVVLIASAAGGPGWMAASSEAVLATHLEHTAASPLYNVLASVAAYLPVGEPGFRLALLGALLGALTILGVLRAARALFPNDPIATLVGPTLLLLAAPFRDAAGFAHPPMLAACGMVWAFALAAEHGSRAHAREVNEKRDAKKPEQKRGKKKAKAGDAGADKARGEKKEDTAGRNKARGAKKKDTGGDAAGEVDDASLDMRTPLGALADGDQPRSDAVGGVDGPHLDMRTPVGALACTAIVVGAAPWLGAPLLVLIVLWLLRTDVPRNVIALSVGTIGALSIFLWIGAVGRMSDPSFDLTAFVTSTSRGAVLVGVGLLGIAFAAITKLRFANWLAITIVIAALHSLFIDHDATVIVALFAIGAAVLPAALVRVMPDRRHAIATVAAVPLVGTALLVAPTFGVDDPGDAPARLASDLLEEVPPGPGVFVATRPATWSAIEYAQLVTIARPDLALVPPLPATHSDVIVKQALVTNRVAAADVFGFGRLDPRRAFPRGRGFQLFLAEPAKLAPIPPPAKYRSVIGERESVLLALSLAQYEAGYERLDAAAHAAGLTKRFGAADLALLKTARLSRPPLFSALPSLGTPVGPWLLDTLGDDLAWVAGIDDDSSSGPAPRRLHALWRKLLTGKIKADDPAIAALGPDAVKATAALVEKPR